MLVDTSIRWDMEAQVVVVGYGGAGSVAAITAHDAGADVLILEKQAPDQHYTGTGMSGGGFLSPPEPRTAARYMEELYRVGEGRSWVEDKALIDSWAAYVCQNKEWVEKTTSTSVLPFGITAESTLPGWDSMVCYQFRGRGYGLFNTLRDQVKKRGIRVLHNIRARNLLTDLKGRVVGVKAEQQVGSNQWQDVYIRAAKAVILTCGGFQFNERLKLQYLMVYPFYGHGTPAATGDGIRMALEVGADLWHMNCCTGRLMAKFPDFPIAFSLDLGGKGWLLREARADAAHKQGEAGFIVVDQMGRRYTNENAKPHYVHYEMALFDSQRLAHLRLPSFWVFDQKRMDAGPLVNTEIGAAGPYRLYPWSRDNQKELERDWITQGENMAELARKLSIDAHNLEGTVASYNSYCRQGEDPEFGRKPWDLVPLDSPPYYGLKLYPGGPTTHGGPRRNARAQIVNPDGAPIPGLYGAGELGSIHGMLYIAGGGFLAECIAFGRLAGENAVREP